MDVNHYELLDVGQDATTDEIQSAYRRLVRTAHPDVGGSAALFRLVQAAHDVLVDPARRTVYDGDRAASNPPQDATRARRRPSGPPPARSQASTFGQPDLSGVAARYGQAAADAGAQGEREVADVLRAANLPAHAMVFHDLTAVAGSNANIDHVVVVGDLLVVIDAERWSPGSYGWDPNGGAWRDRQWFDLGNAATTASLTSQFLADLGWHGRWMRLLAISCSDRSRLDLSHFNHPDFVVVKAPDLPRWLDRQVASANPAITITPEQLRHLIARVNHPAVCAALPGSVRRVG